MLDIAAGCNEMTGLGYVGVDLVLDRTKGPLMLELNARPGLNIQIANRAGIGARLEAVDRANAGSLSKRRAYRLCEGDVRDRREIGCEVVCGKPQSAHSRVSGNPAPQNEMAGAEAGHSKSSR